MMPAPRDQADTAAAPAGPPRGFLDRPLTDEDLARGADWAARPADLREGATIALLLVRLGEETVALPAKQLRRVTGYSRPTPVPHRGSAVMRGLCNIRGELVLCADLAAMLGLPARAAPGGAVQSDADPRRMVIMGPADASWGFEVDGLIGVERIPASGLGAAPVTVKYALAGYALGVADIRGERVTVLDADRVLRDFQAALP
jgi:chemotaxis-related protein WspD